VKKLEINKNNDHDQRKSAGEPRSHLSG
jgi:hypothetical protein